MKRKFLNTNEIAIFCQPKDMEGMNSAVIKGPCETATDAWLRISKGYDAEHIDMVLRGTIEDRHLEDVTEEVGDELAFYFADQDLPESTAPAFVDRGEIQTFVHGIRNEWQRMREQGVA